MWPLEQVLSCFEGVKPGKDAQHYLAKCPCHEDKRESMMINVHDDHYSFKCFAGCEGKAIYAHVRSRLGDDPRFKRKYKKREKSEQNKERKETKKTLVKSYRYTDLEGKVIAEALRYEPKTFGVRVPDATKPDGWNWSKPKDLEIPLYLLPTVREAITKKLAVFLVDGEKDADALATQLICGTCNLGGGGAFRDYHAKDLDGADIVYIIPDHDEKPNGTRPGLDQAFARGEILFEAGLTVKILELPKKYKDHDVKDCFDFFAAGATRDDFLALLPTAYDFFPSDKDPTPKWCRLPGNFYTYLDFVRSLIPTIESQREILSYAGDIVRVEDHGGAVAIRGVSASAFCTIAPRYFRFFEPGKGEDAKDVIKALSERTAAVTLASPYFQEVVPKLKVLLDHRAPFIDGERISYAIPGYFKRSQSYVSKAAPPEADMTLEEAKAVIEDITCDFCFDPDEYAKHHAAYVSYLLTGYCRLLCGDERPPVFLADGNRVGVGKDFALGLYSILFHGCIPDTIAPSANEDESRKRLFAAAKSGKPLLIISNLKHKLSDASLEQAATSSYISDRPMGSSELQTVPNRVVYAISGNNPTFSADMARRIVRFRLVFQEKSVDNRKYKHANLYEYCLANRGRILGAFKALVKNWEVLGQPKASTIKTGFGNWSRIIGIMEAAGYVSPIDNGAGVEMDSLTLQLADLAEALSQTPSFYLFSNNGYKIDDILKFCNSQNIFQWMKDIDTLGRAASSRMGQILSDYSGRDLGGLCICQNQSEKRYKKYIIDTYPPTKPQTQKPKEII